MIPKRAFFFWEGEPMSWLRQQSIETFKKLNPGWSVEIIQGNGVPISGMDRLCVVHRSDWARYKELHERGGVYFDTDMVFLKPVPEWWLQKDLLLCSEIGTAVANIAILGGVPGNKFFKQLDSLCEIEWKRRQDERNPLPYQSLGVVMLNKNQAGLLTEPFEAVDGHSVCPINWHEVEFLWDEDGIPVPLSFALHWYGGDWLGVHMENVADEEWLKRSKCMVATAIKSVRGVL